MKAGGPEEPIGRRNGNRVSAQLECRKISPIGDRLRSSLDQQANGTGLQMRAIARGGDGLDMATEQGRDSIGLAAEGNEGGVHPLLAESRFSGNVRQAARRSGRPSQ